MKKKELSQNVIFFLFFFFYFFFFFWGGGGRLEIHVLVGESGVSMPANQYDFCD